MPESRFFRVSPHYGTLEPLRLEFTCGPFHHIVPVHFTRTETTDLFGLRVDGDRALWETHTLGIDRDSKDPAFHRTGSGVTSWNPDKEWRAVPFRFGTRHTTDALFVARDEVRLFSAALGRWVSGKVACRAAQALPAAGRFLSRSVNDNLYIYWEGKQATPKSGQASFYTLRQHHLTLQLTPRVNVTGLRPTLHAVLPLEHRCEPFTRLLSFDAEPAPAIDRGTPLWDQLPPNPRAEVQRADKKARYRRVVSTGGPLRDSRTRAGDWAPDSMFVSGDFGTDRSLIQFYPQGETLGYRILRHDLTVVGEGSLECGPPDLIVPGRFQERPRVGGRTTDIMFYYR